jgi:hypothetical protein
LTLIGDPTAPNVAANKDYVDKHKNDKDNPHQTTWSNLGLKPETFPPSAHTHVEQDITDLDRDVYKGVWQEGITYLYNWQALDAGWLGKCVNPSGTTDRVSPDLIGDRQTSQPVDPTFAMENYSGVVYSGHQYDFVAAGYITEISAKVPTLTNDTNYRFILVDVSVPTAPIYTVIEQPVLREGEWTVIAAGRFLVANGAKLIIYIDALNSGSDTTITGGWTRDANVNDVSVPPLSQFWGTRTNQSNFRVNKTDLDSVNRETELLSIVAGSTVTFVSTINNNQSMSWTVKSAPIDYGTHIGWPDVIYDGTGPAGEVPIGVDCVMTAIVPVPSPTDYYRAIDDLDTNQPTFATLTGVLQYDGVDQAGAENDSFGIRMEFQEARTSPDWLIMSYSPDLAYATLPRVDEGGAVGQWGDNPFENSTIIGIQREVKKYHWNILAPQSTSANTWTLLDSKTMYIYPDQYEVNYTATISGSAIVRKNYLRIRVNGVTIGEEYVFEPKDTDEVITLSLNSYLFDSTGATLIEIEGYTQANGTLTLEDFRLTFKVW